MTLNFFQSPNAKRQPSYRISERFNQTGSQYSPGPCEYQKISTFGDSAKTSRLQKHRLNSIISSVQNTNIINFTINRIKDKECLPAPNAYSPNYKVIDKQQPQTRSIYTKFYRKNQQRQDPGPGYYNPEFKSGSPSYTMRFKCDTQDNDKFGFPSPNQYQRLPNINNDFTLKTKKQ
ncbi:hypothetical protein SS50377_24711 [Spironucleus salmonicida]|uniref:SHIPPO 1-like protein n=1 Tax=Spironucleus salmonicida TaxID=348837 RepID=V6LJ43_9EUKA|nr:hypothetical protein SS50377_24711 [Spironucleus salmonicida]|eukprot:EST44592.1 Hypothetical protein SS50377_15597 [Spironucleus salmonicida]